ncbi:elongation factor G [Megasphaera sp. DJF_B143]|uniref:elongation factor G n=1 Tax=Megasphaera sp. DJF_B143 TaxID=537288 RepID=UPI00073EE531|nr:elongation factor G [Megasphaera sp. DJF_B143]KUH56467.1 elongation factor G [Megasphaera sp. DJF_B143]
MKEYASDKIRNVAVLSHDGAGKTAVVESLLLACGAVDAVGVGKDNKHIMDFEPEEIKRNVTIQLGIAPCEWQGYKLNFIDTPGYSEFCGEVRAALRAADGILMVVSADAGVEMDTERAWDYGVELQLPRMIYVNKMDAENADFFGCLEKMRAVFGKSIMPLQIPIGEGNDFRGIIDVCKMIAWEWKEGKAEEIKVPAEYMPKAREVREMCMEAAAEGDDELLEKYLEGEELTIDELRQGLRQGMLTGRVCPVMCGSAVHHIGTTELLGRIIRYMPDASQKVMMGTDKKTGEPVMVYPNKLFTGFVFKTLIDPFAGKLSYVRIFSGELKEGDKLYNVTQDTEEKLGKMFTLVGKEQVPVKDAIAGDIVVIPKLAHARTGDTFATAEFPVEYDPIRFPNPLHTVAMVPEKKGDEEKLMTALSKISEEDPTCQVEKNAEGKQILVRCMGDVHLEHIMNKMERKYGVKGILKPVYIPYRETINGVTEVEGKHKKQSGGHGQYGHVKLKLEPLTNGEDFEFVDAIFGGAVPRQYIPAVEKGVKETLEKGLVAGYPMIHVKVTLEDGSYHPVDSSEMAFKVAAALALKKGVPEAKPAILEPVYNVDVIVPEEYMGDVMGDFSGRRGRILGMEHHPSHKNLIVVKAQVPLAEMSGYVTILRSMTQGKGTFNMSFFDYEEVPKKTMDEIIAASQAGKEE